MEITTSLEEDDGQKWIDDPRNMTVWNCRGKAFRVWPISKLMVVLVDVNTGGEIKLTNSELKLYLSIGELIEIDFSKNQSVTLGTGGTTAARKSTPEKEGSVVGKYGKPDSIEGKYKMGVMKQLLAEGKKVLPPKEEEENQVEDEQLELPVITQAASTVVGKYAKRTE